MSERARFVVVANRLPVDRIVGDDGEVDWRTSPGGLVTALEPVMRRMGGAWVGWHGAPDETVEAFEHDGYSIIPVPLSAEEYEEYYEASPMRRCGRCTTTPSPSLSSTANGGTPT